MSTIPIRVSKNLGRIVFSLAITITMFFLPTTGAHIIGPGIVEPKSDGWSLIDTEAEVYHSIVNDIDRVSVSSATKGLGIVFAGQKCYQNGSTAAWIGYSRLNGTMVWQKTITDPHMQTITAIQFNTTSQVYLAGSGPAGASVWCIDVNGSIAWNSTFGAPGDIVRSMAIIKHDAGFTSNDNGITVACTPITGIFDQIVNLESSTGNLTLQHTPVISQASDVGHVEVLDVATDPLLPSIVYIGGQYKNDTTGRWGAFLEQFNITSGVPAWHRAIQFQDKDCAIHGIQVEPVYGHVFCIGEIGGDAMVYPFMWHSGEDGWNTRPIPYVRWGGSKNDVATDVVIVGEQSFMLYVTGWTDGWSIGGKDAFVFKMDYDARIQWEKTWGGMFDDVASSITAEPGIGIFISGTTASKGFVVENPSGDINPAVKWFGSNDMVIMFTIAVSGGIILTVITVFVWNRRKKRDMLQEWVSKKKQEQGNEQAA